MMRRPISIAMVLSVVIHVALFIAADRLISIREEPSISSTVLIVSLRPSAAEDGYSAEENFEHRTTTVESAGPAENRMANMAAYQQAKIAAATKAVVTAEKVPGDLGPERRLECWLLFRRTELP